MRFERLGISENVFGHPIRDDIEFPWERTDKAEALKHAAGV